MFTGYCSVVRNSPCDVCVAVIQFVLSWVQKEPENQQSLKFN